MKTNGGLAQMAADDAASAAEIGIGTGTTAAALGDTAMEAEVATVGRFAVVGASAVGPVATIQGFSQNMPASAEVTEVGCFAAGGAMLSRNVQAAQTILQNVGCIVTIQNTYSNA